MKTILRLNNLGYAIRFLPTAGASNILPRIQFPHIAAYNVAGGNSVVFALRVVGPGTVNWQWSAGAYCFLMAGQTASIEQFYFVYQVSGSVVTLSVQRRAAANNQVSIGVTLELGRTYIIAFTSGAAGCVLYVDGVARATGAASVTQTTFGNTGVQVGNTAFNGNSNVMLTKLCYFNRTLTAAEVLLLSTYPGLMPDALRSSLVLWAPLDHKAGTVARDFSSFANHGTLTSFTSTALGAANAWIDAYTLNPVTA